ncbi:MAG: oligoribonuclease [Pseudomonadota bacterium]
MEHSNKNLIWIDLEMTGLEPDHDRIIEIATIVTDVHLVEQIEGPVLAVHQDDSLLDAMDEWNTKQHGSSGLTARVRASATDETTAVRETIAFLEQWVPAGVSPMCGNSICQDRRFLYKYMPALADYFHYRNLDVSTLKELQQRWVPDAPKFAKKGSHLALDDIRDSIDELRFYRENFLLLPPA